MWKRIKAFFQSEEKLYSNPDRDFGYRIVTTLQGVTIIHPKMETKSIDWDKINEIWLLNTDKGPVACDIWLVLRGDDVTCLIPQTIEGYTRVYNIVSKFEGFNFENASSSMSCVDKQRFLLWKKD